MDIPLESRRVCNAVAYPLHRPEDTHPLGTWRELHCLTHPDTKKRKKSTGQRSRSTTNANLYSGNRWRGGRGESGSAEVSPPAPPTPVPAIVPGPR